MRDSESHRQPEEKQRHQGPTAAALLPWRGDVEVDLRNCEIRIGPKILRLRRCICGLKALELIARRPGFRWKIEEVLDEIWGPGEGSAQTLRSHVSRLRRLLRQSPEAKFHDLAGRIRCADGYWYLDLGADL